MNQASMTVEEAAAALAKHIADVGERAAALKDQHARALAKFKRLAPKPGDVPSRKAWREFARYSAQAASMLEELRAAESQMQGIAELIEARCRGSDQSWQ
jgi:hypothetical protein